MPRISTTNRRNATKVLLLAGLIAGTLDICTAFVQVYLRSSKSPLPVLNYISSAIFGKERAYAGGTPMMILGLLLHYFIAFAFTFFFFWLYPKWNALSKNRFLTAVGYGLFVWAVMNLVVVPLSRISRFPSDPKQAAIAAAILICMIGLPLSFIIGGYFDKSRQK
ncbi:MAG: hypothetical protein JO301_02230 [Chitinophagaceae bacterium]|nr:hypothetical protein [Chitinophagaceae bacterium]